MKKVSIICDIDGVLLDSEHIFDRIEKTGLNGNDKWDFFNRRANDHDVLADSRIIDILEAFALTGYEIVFMTARSSEIWKQTWVKIEMSIAEFAQYHFGFTLLMRDEADKRPSNEVKEDLLKKLQETNSVLLAIDDDPINCEMFAKNNILTLQVQKKREVNRHENY